MIRFISLFLTVAVMLFSLTAPAYAADGEGDSGVFDVLWDIFSSIGNFFSGIFDAIWDGLKWLLDGIKTLFIPYEDYFPRAFERIKGKLSQKLGGISGLISMIRAALSGFLVLATFAFCYRRIIDTINI